MRVEQRLEELGLALPEPPEVPPGFKFPFRWVRVWGGKAYVSGHSAQAPDGSFTGPFGKVPIEVSLEAAQQAAAKTALSVLGNLKRALGDLDRVTAWLMVNGMVNADPGYSQTTHAINGFSDLIVDLTGRKSAHTPASRSAWPLFRSTTRSSLLRRSRLLTSNPGQGLATLTLHGASWMNSSLLSLHS